MLGNTISSIKSTFGLKLGFFSPLFVTTILFLILARAFRKKHVAADKIEMIGHVAVQCSSKMTQRSSAADWTKF